MQYWLYGFTISDDAKAAEIHFHLESTPFVPDERGRIRIFSAGKELKFQFIRIEIKPHTLFFGTSLIKHDPVNPLNTEDLHNACHAARGAILFDLQLAEHINESDLGLFVIDEKISS